MITVRLLGCSLYAAASPDAVMLPDFDEQCIEVVYFDANNHQIDAVPISIDDSYSFNDAMRTWLDDMTTRDKGNLTWGYLRVADNDKRRIQVMELKFAID